MLDFERAAGIELIEDQSRFGQLPVVMIGIPPCVPAPIVDRIRADVGRHQDSAAGYCVGHGLNGWVV